MYTVMKINHNHPDVSVIYTEYDNADDAHEDYLYYKINGDPQNMDVKVIFNGEVIFS